MNWLQRLRQRGRGNSQESELAEEMRLHIELRAEQNEANGMTAEDARREARTRFGNTTLTQESSRAALNWEPVEQLLQDVRYGIRALIANPSFTWTAVLSLALGIGANTAIFSLMDKVLFKSLPVTNPEALVQVQIGENNDELNLPFWQNIRAQQQVFSTMLAGAPAQFDLSDSGDTRIVQGMWISGGGFEALGVPMHLGRGISAEDDQWGGAPVAVISYSFWQSHFLGAAEVLGKSIPINRQRVPIVGVTPPWFTGIDRDHKYQIAVPLGSVPVFDPSRKPPDEYFHWWLHVVGRLKPGVTMAQAQDRLTLAAPEIFRASLPKRKGMGDRKDRFVFKAAALGFSETRDRYRTALYVLMATVGLVLLIACANIANLLLARASARQREISVRMAIGASRWRIVRQLMTESLLIAAAGASLGFLCAIWGSKALVSLISTSSNRIEIDVSPDARLLAFAMGITLLTTLLFGLAPALRSTRLAVSRVLKENEKGSVRGARRFDLRKGLLAAQLGLSLMLLVGTGLFLGTFRNLLAVDTGFLSKNVLIVSARVRDIATPANRRARIFENVLARLRSEPAVVSAATSVLTPIGPHGWAQPTEPEGFVPKDIRDTLLFFNQLSPGYFKTLRTPVILGRDFNERDTTTSLKVIVINETASRRFFANANPLGKSIGIEKVLYQVIGVVRDTKYNRVDEAARPIGFLAAAQAAEAPNSTEFSIRSERDLETLIPALRAAIDSVEPGLALEFHSFESRVTESLSQPRAVAQLSLFFASAALTLSVVGVFGIVSYSVARRRAELGIRTALGARPASLIWLVMRDTGLLVIVGLIAGLLVSLAVARWIATMLYDVKPNDPGTFAAAIGLLALASALAAFVPALRATRLDPMSALREE